MAEHAIAKEGSQKQRRPRTAVRYPRYSLADSVTAAKAIHEQGGGVASPDRLAAFLGYSSTRNGAYLNRVAAGRLFGVITDKGRDMVITPLAQKVLMPVYPDQAVEALVEAFFNVPLFKQIYETYSGKELPPEFGMKNLLRSQYGLTAEQSDVAYRVLMDSAEEGRLFATRGTRTHLIIPQTSVRPPETTERPATTTPATSGGDGTGQGSGTGGTTAVQTRPTGDLRSAYVATLIDMLREKSKTGEVDTDLMGRIEKLLSIDAS